MSNQAQAEDGVVNHADDVNRLPQEGSSTLRRNDDLRSSRSTGGTMRTRSVAYSIISSRLNDSGIARKRRLEFEAEEERARIKKASLAAQEAIDLEMVNRRLQLKLVEVTESRDQGAHHGFPAYSDHNDFAPTNEYVQRWVDSTGVQSPRSITHAIPRSMSPVEPKEVTQLAQAITRAVELAQERSNPSTATHRLVTRMTASKDLPIFEGDPLEWPRFKRAFESSTERGGYSADENVSRLYHCLRKDAKEAVASLMITATDTHQIMETLQLRFGNPDLIARKVVRELKRLPKLDSSRGCLVTFATTVKNCIAAMEAINHLGYLHSPELLADIISKIPEAMVHSYNRFYHQHRTPDEPKLAVLSKFLVFEAEIACLAGTSETVRQSRSDRSGARNEDRAHGSYRHRETVLLTRDNEKSSPTRKEVDRRRSCGYCGNDRHLVTGCSRFTELPVRKRWRWAKDSGVCFRCLVEKHNRNRCREETCRQPACGRAHHSLLHSEKGPSAPINPNPNTGSNPNDTHVTANTWLSRGRRVLLKVVPVRLQGPRGSVSTHALLDGGSTVTLLDSDIADKIGAQGETVPLQLHGVSRMNTTIAESRRVDFQVSGDHSESKLFSISGARTMPNLILPCQSLKEDDIKGHRHLFEIDVHWYRDAMPKLLIGQDHWDLITPLEVRGTTRDAPVASLTNLGWVIHGYATPTLRDKHREHALHLHNVENSEECARVDSEELKKQYDTTLHDLVKIGFSLESMGTTSVSRKNAMDQRAEHIMVTTSRRRGDRWETGLLWNNDVVKFPDSYRNALNRLKSLERKMKKEPEFASSYTKQMNHLINSGYASKVTFPLQDSDRQWYLPHFGVTNPNKPGKLRLVFDAAARVQGISLNDRLLSGPDYLNSLLGVLMRFRQNRIAFSADIKEMFLQVKIREEDQRAQLFLWRDGDSHREPETYCMTSMIFGATSSPSSALYIKNRNAQEFEGEYPRAVEAIIRRHYMDDYLDSVDTIEEATKLISEVVNIHAQGGFDICAWTSNDVTALSGLPLNKLTKGAVDLTLDKHPGERTLGLIWNPREDTRTFALNFTKLPAEIVSGSKRPTKREMLRVIMSIFDPQGFLTPFTVGSKILLQDVWRSGVGWDEQLADKEFEEWKKWLLKLQEVPLCVIPRCYASQESIAGNAELHIFCDASSQALAAVGYWRWKNGCGETRLAFIAGKSRVAPIKPKLSIPRMELQAALLGSRLARTIISEHDVTVRKRVFWSDARVVLFWIKSDPRKHNVWLSNRLGEIDELTNVEEWRWVPTKDNPADEGTRDTGRVPQPHSQWFRGPSFLLNEESQWPKTTISNEDDVDNEDLRSEVVAMTTDLPPQVLPDVSRFSSWLRLIRTTAWVLLFLDVCRERKKFELNLSYIQRAEQLWIRQIQRESFQSEVKALIDGKPVAKCSRLLQLTPIVDEDGILRVRGRINAAENVAATMKTPVILDGRHPYVKLLVQHYHQQAGHGTPETVLNELRQRYWIVHARPTVRSVSARCQWCRIQRAKPHPPLMGDLPSARLAHHQRPFTHCGVDYFGPMTVKIGRRQEKRWGVLFTCLTTRAVHLEMAASLKTDSAIMALRRFAARRGYPNEIWSDNGTNFHGADSELRQAMQALDKEQLAAEATARRAVWHFIPPFSPHMGGCWERLIRSVKVALKATLRERTPKEEVLATLLTEAEHAVNSRPLSRVSSDPRDPESLTPNHFLLGASSGVPTPGTFGDDDLCSRKQWRTAQRLADMFWARWIREYLPTLQPRKRWNQEEPAVGIGDVVFIMDNAAPRNVWPRGVVTRVFPGQDGRIRVAEVRTGNRIFKRAVAKLVVLATK